MSPPSCRAVALATPWSLPSPPATSFDCPKQRRLSCSGDAVAEIIEIDGPNILLTLYKFASSDRSPAAQDLRVKFLRLVQDFARCRHKINGKSVRPGQEPFATVWLPFLLTRIERGTEHEDPLLMRECTRALLDLTSKSGDLMKSAVKHKKALQILVGVRLPCMGDMT